MIYACAALYTLGIVDFCRAVFVHGDSLDLASHFAGTFMVGDCAVRANFCACATLFALGLVDMRHMLTVKRDCAELAHVFAAMHKTASACARDFIAAHRTLVASNINDFDDVGIVLVSAHCKFDAFTQNRAFFVHATTHRRHFAGNDTLGDVDGVGVERTRPRLSCDLAQNFVFEMLNFCIEYSHLCPLKIIVRLRHYTLNRLVRNKILFRFEKNICIFRSLSEV